MTSTILEESLAQVNGSSASRVLLSGGTAPYSTQMTSTERFGVMAPRVAARPSLGTTLLSLASALFPATDCFSSVLINNLLHLPGDIAVAYMYCFAQHHVVQTAETLVGALIKQIVLRKIVEGKLPDIVEDLYEKIGLDGKPSLATLVELLRDVTRLFAQVYIVVDGIDEVEEDTFGKLLDGALKMIPQNKTKFLISSRPHAYRISKYLEFGFKITVKAPEADVREYLSRQIKRNESLEMVIGDDPLLFKDMISEISQQCRGQ